jgi:indoleacetamide hydrolase
VTRGLSLFRSRRLFVKGVTTATAAVLLDLGRSPASASPPSPLEQLSAVGALRAMARGEVTAESYVATLLARCHAMSDLNAFITLDADRALESARDCDRRRSTTSKLGPLHGLPIPIKDSVNVKGYPTTAGTPALRHFRPVDDAPIVQKLRTAGAIVLGKTNMHELSFGWTSNNKWFGAVHNPYNRACVSGGSSGGSAAAVAARLAPLSVAEDTEGSIRIPAALCGVTGFRPTTGRYPTGGVVPITPLFDQLGPHARTVADLLLFDSVVSGPFADLKAASLAPLPTSLHGTRLGIYRDYWFQGLDPDVSGVVEKAFQRLKSAGAEFVEIDIPHLTDLIRRTTAQVQGHDFRPSVSEFLRRYRTNVTYAELLHSVSPEVAAEIADYTTPEGHYFAGEESYRKACSVYLPTLRKTFHECFSRTRIAAIVFPATLTPAPRIGQERSVSIGGKEISLDTALGRNMDPGSTTGLPGLVLPAGLTPRGLPVCLEFDGPAGHDRALLSLGLALEAALGQLQAPPG